MVVVYIRVLVGQRWMDYMHLSSALPSKFGFGLRLYRETTTKWCFMPTLIGVVIRTGYFGIADHPRMKKLRLSATTGKRIKP